MEVATWNGPNINRTSARLGLRSEASARFEKGLSPEQAMEAQAVATRLMVELCGARLVGGTIDVGGAGPAARRRCACATRAVSRAARRRRPARAPARRSSSALGFGVAEARRRPGRHRAALPAQRRHARGGPDRGGRAHRRRSRGCPPRCPSRTGRAGRPRRARSACAGAPRTCSSAAACTRSSAGRSPTPGAARPPAPARRRPAAPRSCALENPMSETSRSCARRCSARCWTPRAHNVARGNADLRALRVGRRLPRRRASALPARAPRAGRRAARRARPASWRGGAAPRADFFAAKGLLERGARRRCACLVAVESRPPQPFLHPGRARARARRRATRGRASSASCTRSSPRDWDLDEPVAAFAIDLGRVVAARAGGRDVRRPHDVPGACARTSRSSCPTDVPPPTSSPWSARAAASCCAACGSSTSTAARRSARGALARAAPRVPRARPHADRRGGRAARASAIAARRARPSSGRSSRA